MTRMGLAAKSRCLRHDGLSATGSSTDGLLVGGIWTTAHLPPSSRGDLLFSPPRAPKRESGQALVPVLFVVLILTAFAVTLTGRARTEMRAANNYLRQEQQYYIARGALTYAMNVLQQATNGGAAPPQLTTPPDTDSNGWTQLGDGWYKLDIIDTASRVNINLATADTLVKIPTLQNAPDLAAAIMDWRDTDETTTTNVGTLNATGAESDYYQQLNPPYMCKNAPFDTIEELLLVKGFTPEALYNQPSTANVSGGGNVTIGIMNRSRQQTTGGGGQTTGSITPPVDTSSSTLPMSELITTYSKELNVDSDGNQRVNIKTASQQDLVQKLGLSTQVAQSIVNGRGQNGASINSIADLLNTANFPGITRQVMQQIGDKITVADGQYREGMLNINTATAEALATISGVDSTTYNAVVNARQGGTLFTGLNDLFQLTTLNRQQLATLVDHVCTKSSIYLIRVRVRMPGTQNIFAVEGLVELTPNPQTSTTGGTGTTGAAAQQSSNTTAQPKLLQWREVGRSPGWNEWSPSPNFYTTGARIGGT